MTIGYYMRYLVADKREVTLAQLEAALREIDSQYSIPVIREQPSEVGYLLYRGSQYGELWIDRPPEEEELEELREDVEESKGRKKLTVLRALEKATAIVAVCVRYQDRGVEETMVRIDPLWEWLFNNRKGILQADGEGFYDQSGLILKMEYR